ncbi:MAG: alpha/beta fold hydrolase [Janthinobacterium lividum]
MSIIESTPAVDLVTDAAAQAVLRRNNVRLTGTGKPPLLFCNGFNCGQSVWHFLAPVLAKQYQLVFFDQVGVGKSDRSICRSPRYHSLNGFAQDMLEICQALQLRDVVAVGHSAGALVAMLAAIQAPEVIAKTVLLAASPRYLNTPDYYGGFAEKDLSDMLLEMGANYQAWANTFATMMIGQHHAPELSHELVECASQADPEIAKHIVQLVFLGDYRSQVPKLQQPTLLLQCTDDPAVPEEVSQYLLQHLPHATLVNLPVAGHCPHLTAPDEVLAAMQQFIKMPA